MLRTLIQQTKCHCNQHIRQYARSYRYRPNPGIRRQDSAATNETNVSEYNDIEDLSKFESEFGNTTDTLEEYQRETKEQKEKLKQFIVRNKYFNVKQLTFLTWAEMEQIRLLNAKDSEEWNENKLAESFPADLLTIKKVLKAKWQPKDAKRIAKHDEKVRVNWKSFIDGGIDDLDPKLSEHLKNFSARNLNQQIDYDSVLKKELPKPKGTEFLDVITSCKKYKEEPRQIASDHSITLPEAPTAETFVLGKIGSQKLCTFKPTDSKKNYNVTESAIIFNNPGGSGIKKTENNISTKKESSASAVSKYETNEVQLSENQLKQLSLPTIPQYIRIPAKLYKEGATYQLDDCYYDDDGEFLYRVPGMTGR